MSGEPESRSGDLLALLDLQSQGQGMFIGPPAPTDPRFPRVFGGQLLAQALAAASFTVPDDALCHSLHAYFVRPGLPGRPIDFEVTAMRDGQSFLLRNVAAVQRDELVFQLTASFGRDQAGAEYRPAMPDTPAPETFPSEDARIASLLERADPRVRAFYVNRHPVVEMISVDVTDLSERTPIATPVRCWVRLRDSLPSDPRLYRCVLAYCSDMGLLGPSVRAIGGMFGDPELQIASLDHALWFHREFDFSDWLLFVSESCSVAGGRGLSRGSYFTRDGRLVASIAQEGLMRKRDPLAERE
jgi:acyl-CoA thioesterase II